MARTGRDLTGQKFGKLTVLGFGGYEQNTRQRVAMWNCHCDCGSDGEKAAAVSGGQQGRWKENALENWWFWEKILTIRPH